MTGYAHPAYAQSLAEFGSPRSLPLSEGLILEREIPGFPLRDGMGCYPLFACENWNRLHADLNDLQDVLVSIVLVADPFGEYDEKYLKYCFKDLMVAFKEHHVTDLHRPLKRIVSKHHHYYSRKALGHTSVEICSNAQDYAAEWAALYSALVQRHNLKGIKAFSTAALTKQLSVPGTIIFRALHNGSTIGAHVWYVGREVAYSHLAAFSALGYELMASYALYWSALEYFAGRVRWLDLGSGAGLQNKDQDGLSQFKRGWATGTRTAYLCGRIYNPVKYSSIVEARGNPQTSYFPAYRAGEF